MRSTIGAMLAASLLTLENGVVAIVAFLLVCALAALVFIERKVDSLEQTTEHQSKRLDSLEARVRRQPSDTS